MLNNPLTAEGLMLDRGAFYWDRYKHRIVSQIYYGKAWLVLREEELGSFKNRP